MLDDISFKKKSMKVTIKFLQGDPAEKSLNCLFSTCGSRKHLKFNVFYICLAFIKDR